MSLSSPALSGKFFFTAPSGKPPSGKKPSPKVLEEDPQSKLQIKKPRDEAAGSRVEAHRGHEWQWGLSPWPQLCSETAGHRLGTRSGLSGGGQLSLKVPGGLKPL